MPEGDAPDIVQRNEEEDSPLGQCDSPAGVLVSPNSEQVTAADDVLLLRECERWCAAADRAHSVLLVQCAAGKGTHSVLLLQCAAAEGVHHSHCSRHTV